MKSIAFLITLAAGILMLAASLDFPDWSAPTTPASTHLSPHYIEKSIEETSVPNLVTSVLADYRGYDTMFETVVIFCGGITVLTLIRRTFIRKDKYINPRPVREDSDIILQSAVRILVPLIQVFALYVVAHGHHSPGGGFQGGVILGASFILLSIAYDLKFVLKRLKENSILFFSILGVTIYAGIGLVSLFLGQNFLAYAAWAELFGITEVEAHSHGMLGVEIGVAITVTAIMLSLYADLSSGGDLDEGL